MKDKNKVIKAGAILNVAVTVLYVCVLLLMFSRITFTVSSERVADDFFVLFLSPNAERVIYWISVIAVSSLLSLSLFKHAFDSDLWRILTFAAAVTLCIFELISLVSPLWGQVSIYFKMKARDIPYEMNMNWSFISFLMLAVTLIRIYISYAALVLWNLPEFFARIKKRAAEKR